MSMDYSDVWELGAVSDCCGAGVYLNGICSNCNDHCTPEFAVDEDYGCVIGQHQDYYSPIFHNEEEE